MSSSHFRRLFTFQVGILAALQTLAVFLFMEDFYALGGLYVGSVLPKYITGTLFVALSLLFSAVCWFLLIEGHPGLASFCLSLGIASYLVLDIGSEPSASDRIDSDIAYLTDCTGESSTKCLSLLDGETVLEIPSTECLASLPSRRPLIVQYTRGELGARKASYVDAGSYGCPLFGLGEPSFPSLVSPI